MAWFLLIGTLPFAFLCYFSVDSKWLFLGGLTVALTVYITARTAIQPLIEAQTGILSEVRNTIYKFSDSSSEHTGYGSRYNELAILETLIDRLIGNLRDSNDQLKSQKKKAQQKKEEIGTSQQLAAEKTHSLELANKYKSEFLANMSHELRTPLNSIMLLSRYLTQNKEMNLSEDQLASLHSIYMSGTDLLVLINEILDLSKVEAGKMEINPEEMHLKEFADAMYNKFRPLADEKTLQFELTIADEIPVSIQTDPHRVDQIIKNFLTNAIKFTSQGKIIFQVQEACNLNRIDILCPHLDPEQFIVFTVKDTGIGIPLEKQELIFEAFQQADGTTSRHYGGTGLGLSISKKLAELLAGHILLQSNQPQGSVFHLLLPKTFIMQQENRILPEHNPASGSQNIINQDPNDKNDGQRHQTIDAIKDDRKSINKGDLSVLIIEDEMTHIERIIEHAKSHHFKFILAGDGQTGLHYAEYYQPSAVILDLHHPGLSSWTVISRLKDNRQTRHIPVCFISKTERSLEAKKMGAVAFLTHPVEGPQLDVVFNKLKAVAVKPVKDLLLVEDDPLQQKSIAGIIRNDDVNITNAKTAAEAFNAVISDQMDCIVLDLGLPDISGLELLEQIRKNAAIHQIPIIIYTSRELTPKENALIDAYAESTIIKSANSHKKLLDETTIYLHRNEENLSAVQQDMLRLLHDRKSILSDKTILIIDDDMRTVFSIKKILEDEGMKVLAGKNGNDGIATLNKHPQIDLIITDILMPEMDGYQTMTAIRQQPQFKKLPIIALTVKAMQGDRAKCIEAGANDYLAKPVDTDRLFSMLKVWLYE